MPVFALAQDPSDGFPVKSVRLIVPYAAGGPNDIVARVLGQKLSERWKQQVIIDNRGGANGVIGAELAAKAPADGYTLFLGNAGVMASNPALYAKLPYNAEKDFAAVSLMVQAPLLLVTHPSFNIKSVADLVNQAKSRPGQLSFGSGGTGGVAHLAGELLNYLTSIKTVHIAYKGAAPAMTDLLGGQIAFTFTGPLAALPNIKAGKLTGVAVTTQKRAASLPDIPAVAETIPGYEVRAWYGIVVPARTSKPIIDRINRDIAAAIQMPDVVQRFTSDGGEVTGGTPASFARLIREEIAMWTRVAKQAQLSLD
jgi:tripartite-type tricarboxylate transporter receptor subunit TctC